MEQLNELINDVNEYTGAYRNTSEFKKKYEKNILKILNDYGSVSILLYSLFFQLFICSCARTSTIINIIGLTMC